MISYFTSSTDQNLSMIVYSAARVGVEPTMYALSTLMFLVILLLLLIDHKPTLQPGRDLTKHDSKGRLL